MSVPAQGDPFSIARPTSGRLYAEALEVFPSGITHDSRYMTPFPLYIQRAQGSRKWDVDGNEYIDFVMGHGALLLGHCHPAIVKAVVAQMSVATHPGGCSEQELEWGRLVKQLIPCAERVRFTSSGTEATMMAMRLARAFTGKQKIVKFAGHFHGWHDYAQIGQAPPFDVPASAGVPACISGTMVSLDPSDEAAIERALETDGDIAGAILETTGASWATVPLRPGFQQWLRELTRKKGIVLIFDEVITGFRYSPGGAQQYLGVVPDLAVLAKILAGGLPGGAVVGRADIMELLSFKDGDSRWNRFQRVSHQGTFNANPIAAAAGSACLKIVGTGEPHRVANELGAALRKGMNEVIRQRGVSACVYGELSIFHIYLGRCERLGDCDKSFCTNDPALLKSARSGPKAHALRKFMLVNGADIQGSGGMLSSAHTVEDVDRTVEIFDKTLGNLAAEGLV